jgi:hypothetical protein
MKGREREMERGREGESNKERDEKIAERLSNALISINYVTGLGKIDRLILS